MVLIPEGYEQVEEGTEVFDLLDEAGMFVENICACGHRESAHVEGGGLCTVHPTPDTICQCERFTLGAHAVAVAELPQELKDAIAAAQAAAKKPEEPKPADNQTE